MPSQEPDQITFPTNDAGAVDLSLAPLDAGNFYLYTASYDDLTTAGCVHPKNQVSATFIASGTTGEPVAAAFADLPDFTDAGDDASIPTISAFQPVTLGALTFFGGSFIDGMARVDMPSGDGRYALSGWVMGSSINYVMPPPGTPSLIVSQVTSLSCSFDPFEYQVMGLKISRMSTSASISLNASPTLPGIAESPNDPLDSLGIDLAKPLPTDAVLACPDMGIFPLAAGTTKLPCGGYVIYSPQLPYSLARQFPTALFRPYQLLSDAIPVGNVDLEYSAALPGDCPL